jgi:hypothetical protein
MESEIIQLICRFILKPGQALPHRWSLPPQKGGSHHRESPWFANIRRAVAPQFLRTLSFGQPLTDAQKERLLWIAVNCPGAKLLQGEIHINTHLSDYPTVSAGMGNYPPSDVASVDATVNYTTQ